MKAEIIEGDMPPGVIFPIDDPQHNLFSLMR
jgi:hypothetical protein